MCLLNQLYSEIFFLCLQFLQSGKNITEDDIVHIVDHSTISNFIFKSYMAFSSGCLREIHVLIYFVWKKNSIPFHTLTSLYTCRLNCSRLRFVFVLSCFLSFFPIYVYFFALMGHSLCSKRSWMIHICVYRSPLLENIHFTSLWGIESLWMRTSFISRHYCHITGFINLIQPAVILHGWRIPGDLDATISTTHSEHNGIILCGSTIYLPISEQCKKHFWNINVNLKQSKQSLEHCFNYVLKLVLHKRKLC